ncbi:MAG: hypothetical protein M3Z67_08010 [Commensalibacter sp.]|nr:hypothetical protein [Commensalibacter sp.]
MSTLEETKDAPEQKAGDWAVQIIDMSGEGEDRIVETIKGFYSIEHANAFARAYVRDSIEHCRLPRASHEEILKTWSNYGEDVEVLADPDMAWYSSSEINNFIENVATPMECDWRALDPRRLMDEEKF